MLCPLLTVSQSDYLIQVDDINSNTEWQTVQIWISWHLQKPIDLDLHCLQRQGISRFSRTRVNKRLKASFLPQLLAVPAVIRTVLYYLSASFPHNLAVAVNCQSVRTYKIKVRNKLNLAQDEVIFKQTECVPNVFFSISSGKFYVLYRSR